MSSTNASSSSLNAKNKKRKRNRSNSTSFSPDADNQRICLHTNIHSRLSLKKRLFVSKSAKQTPWYDTYELLNTGRGLLLALQLFPSLKSDNVFQGMTVPDGLTVENYATLRMALERIALWRSRSNRGDRLPHAIDMTAGLAGVLLMDAERTYSSTAPLTTGSFHRKDLESSLLQPLHHGQRHTNSSSIYQLRNTYSTLLLRCVNGLADLFRSQKRSTLLSVSHCCSLAGFPLWIVAVRHDASHNDLPSIGVCRIAALECLRFWKERYWDLLERNLWGKFETISSDHTCERNEASNTEEIGIYTLAFDCLMRYQKAAWVESNERKETLQKGRLKRFERMEKRRKLRWGQKSQDLQGNIKLPVNNCCQEDMNQFSDRNELLLANRVPDCENSKNESKAQVEENDDFIFLLPESNEDIIPQTEKFKTPRLQKIDSRDSNPWAILDNDEPKRKKKKKTEHEDAARRKVCTENRADCSDEIVQEFENGSLTSSKCSIDENVSRLVQELDSGKNSAESVEKEKLLSTPAKTDKIEPSSRDCAAELIKKIPIDVVFLTTLRFLVWGISTNFSDESTSNDEKYVPFLYPALSNTCTTMNISKLHLSLDDEFDELRIMYEPLLVTITSTYSGFLAALFVHLIDSILCLETERRICHQKQDQTLHSAEADHHISTSVNEANCLKQIEQRIQCHSMWIHYILSRQFFMHIDRSVAFFNREEQSIPQSASSFSSDIKQQLPAQFVDLKKKGEKRWTSAEKDFIRSPLPYQILHRKGIPLNSVCDRMLSYLHDYSKTQDECGGMSFCRGKDSRDSDVITALIQFFEQILEKERVVFMGICDLDAAALSLPTTCPPEEKEELKQMNTPSLSIIEPLSLDAIEALLNTTNNKQEHHDIPVPHIPETNPGLFFGECTKAEQSDINDKSALVDHHGSIFSNLKPWTLCKSWDACAIGMMPGYPG